MDKIKQCPECKSKEILITSNLKGKIFAATCPSCGWEFESQEFKSLAEEMDKTIEQFDRKDILKTKLI